MLTTNKVGYNRKISQFVISSLQSDNNNLNNTSNHNLKSLKDTSNPSNNTSNPSDPSNNLSDPSNISNYNYNNENEKIELNIDEILATKYAIALQTAWRRRIARIMVSNLKQESNCKKYRIEHPILDINNNYIIQNCDTCLNGEINAEIRNKISLQKYTEIERLLFEGQKRLIVTDRGDNWNQRFQV